MFYALCKNKQSRKYLQCCKNLHHCNNVSSPLIIDMARRVGDPEKNVVYVFDVFDVFACLRFSLKVDFIINVSDVFDVFSVFSISPPKN